MNQKINRSGRCSNVKNEMIRLGNNFIGCWFNSIPFWKKLLKLIDFQKKILTLNRRRLPSPHIKLQTSFVHEFLNFTFQIWLCLGSNRTDLVIQFKDPIRQAFKCSSHCSLQFTKLESLTTVNREYCIHT